MARAIMLRGCGIAEIVRPIQRQLNLWVIAVVLDDATVVFMEGPRDLDSLEFRTRLLIKRLVALTGETEPEAVHRAVEERHQRLTGPASVAERRQQILDGMNSLVWRDLKKRDRGRELSKADEDRILGYGAEGV